MEEILTILQYFNGSMPKTACIKMGFLIILDEATANVDPENEKELMEAVAELTHNKTVIMITHRLKTVRNAGMIFVVDLGKIVQQGTHDELVAFDGLCRRFVVDRRQQRRKYKAPQSKKLVLCVDDTSFSVYSLFPVM